MHRSPVWMHDVPISKSEALHPKPQCPNIPHPKTLNQVITQNLTLSMNQVIIIDEAQDFTPCQADAFFGQARHQGPFRVQGLEVFAVQGLRVRGVGCRGIGVQGLGCRGLGCRGLAF